MWFVLSDIFFLLSRRVRSEATLYSEWWRVKWQDVQLQAKSISTSTYSRVGTQGIFNGLVTQCQGSGSSFLVYNLI